MLGGFSRAGPTLRALSFPVQGDHLFNVMLDLTSNLRLKFGCNFYPRATAVFQEMDTIGLSIPKKAVSFSSASTTKRFASQDVRQQTGSFPGRNPWLTRSPASRRVLLDLLAIPSTTSSRFKSTMNEYRLNIRSNNHSPKGALEITANSDYTNRRFRCC